MNLPYLKKLGRKDGFSIWLVSGRWIRNHLDEDFTEGGQSLKWNFIPDDEIWVDDSLDKAERYVTEEHELVEHRAMARGIPYEIAHSKYANVVERRLRDEGKA